MIEYNSGIIKAKLNKSEKTLVNNVSFSLKEGDILSIIGETGSGKTIIAHSIMKLLPDNVFANNYSFIFNNEDLSKKKSITKYLGKEIVYIPQSGLESLNPKITISSQIDDSLRKNKIPKRNYKKYKHDLLLKVGFTNPEEILKKYSFELSGGMGQKIVIMLASISNPKLIIADEPTSALDIKSKNEVINLLKEMFPLAAIILITHDIYEASKSTKCIVLNKGIVVEKGKSKDILTFPNHPYTKALIAATVKNGMHKSIEIRNVNSPCPFANRCNKYQIACNKLICYQKNNFATWRCIYD